jgi:hypothetical protein
MEHAISIMAMLMVLNAPPYPNETEMAPRLRSRISAQ